MNSFWRSGRTKRSEKRTQITSADEVAAKMTAAGCSGGIFWLPADWLNVQEAAKHTKQEQGGAVNLIGLNVSQLWVTFTPEFSPPIDSGASKRGKRESSWWWNLMARPEGLSLRWMPADGVAAAWLSLAAASSSIRQLRRLKSYLKT